MKRSSSHLTTSKHVQQKRAKNIFSLKDFGHSLLQPLVVCASRPLHPTKVPDVIPEDDQWLDVLDDPLSETEPETHTKRKGQRKRKWYASTDDNLRYWTANYREEYLRALVTREGPIDEVEGRCSCGINPKRYRCRECYGGTMFCRDCVVEQHRLHPLCRIEAWNGTFFEPRELRQLGLRVQLGHPDNRACPHAHCAREKFVVIANNGFHHVALDYCQCRRSHGRQRWEQLLLYGWFPSTPDRPQSAITIPTLKLFHAVSLQGKTTVYHFFNALAKITDNTGSRAFKRRYQLVLRVVRQWRNLRALKRGGMGNDPDRTASETREGELAVECIACPRPGVNLPDGWRDASPEMRFLYTIFLAIDACFRLKRKKISTWAADPSLQDGWAYFVRSGPYLEFVKTLGEQKEMSTCTGLAALDHANTKYSQGYAATGCGMVTCGRHEIVAKNGVADLQAGEKYGNMDYVVASAWRHFMGLLFFLLSYDIMCQWSKKLKERLKSLPPAVRLQLALFFVKFVIPKLHILGHLKICQETFSLLFTLGAAQADMEGIERIWSSSGLMGASTREMGPGSRQDTLDDFWHYWNWNKVVGMGDILRTRFLKARKELATQKAALDLFSGAQQADIPAWRKAVDDFEGGVPESKNPYELPKSGVTLRDIELELLGEDHDCERRSGEVRGVAEGTMTEYLMLGLEIEGQQRQLRADLASNRSPTTKDLADFVTRRTRISRQIKKLRLLQRKYSPGALQRLATHPDPVDPPEAEHAPLFLPSSLSPVDCTSPAAVPGLAAAEARLRDAQCSESLDQIRHGLTVKKRLQTYKSLNSRRQHQNTRARSLVDNQQRKIDLAAGTYRCARAVRLALVDIVGPSGWQKLEKADLRLPEDEEEAKRRKQRAMKGKRKKAAELNENGEVQGVPGMGEKSRLISWIWITVGRGDGVLQKEIHAAVKVEWCKAYARVKRWREEFLLLQEEMVRCLRTLEWQAGVWDQRATAAHYTGKKVYGALHLQGAMAFAARQAAVRRTLATRFSRLWWHLTDRIAGPATPESSASSGRDEEDVEAAADASDNDGGTDLDGPSVREDERAAEDMQDVQDGGGEVPEDEKSSASDEEGSVGSAADAAGRRADMEQLLALHGASAPYDEI
ncbi:CxC2 domain-containing protein [Mycena sanguinolenta]|uniref:CxC2 domain-containing protein n=1 Tax=Mycena sanguinolenta TaxID=230812 RepID=A0A8H7CPJ9_9AGAR|nr:CxC2 domain-containing protein [Mycena sanguinolenta]